MILLKKLGKLTFIYCFYLLCIKNCFFDKWVQFCLKLIVSFFKKNTFMILLKKYFYDSFKKIGEIDVYLLF